MCWKGSVTIKRTSIGDGCGHRRNRTYMMACNAIDIVLSTILVMNDIITICDEWHLWTNQVTNF